MKKSGRLAILSIAVFFCPAMFFLSAASEADASMAVVGDKAADDEPRFEVGEVGYVPFGPRCAHDSCVCRFDRTSTELVVPPECVDYETIDTGSGPSNDGCCAIGACVELPCEHYYFKARYRLPCNDCCPLGVKLDWDHGTAGSGTSSVNCGQWTAWTGGGWNKIDCASDCITHTLVYCGQTLVVGYTATEICWECDPTE